MKKLTFFICSLFFSASTYAENNDHGLFSLYEKLISNDYFISKETKKLEASNFKYKSIKSELYPQVDSTLNKSQSRRTSFNDVQSYPSYEKSINLQQVIFDPSLFNKVSKEKNLNDKSYWENQSLVSKRLLDFSIKYFSYLESIDNYQLLQLQLSIVERNLKKSQELYAVQMASIIDINDLFSRKIFLESDILEGMQKIKNNKNLLEEFLGEAIPELLRKPNKELFDISNILPDLSLMKSDLHEKNSDLMIIKLNLLALESNINEHKYKHSPTIHLTASLQDSNIGSAGIRSNDYKSSKAGFLIRIPIFSGGKINYQVKEAISDKDSEIENLKLTQLQLVNELENSYNLFFVKNKKSEDLNKALKYAKKSREASESIFERKLINISDLLYSIRNEYEIEKEIMANKYQILIEYFKIKKITGNLNSDAFSQIDSLLD